MKLIPLPAFQDNYLWLLHDGQRALVVDPGDAAPVQAFLAAQGLRLEAILVTRAVTQLRNLALATKRRARVLVH